MIRNLQRAFRAAFGASRRKRQTEHARREIAAREEVRTKRRNRRAEEHARAVLGMPQHHPEWLTGGEKAAATGDFASWGAELQQDGLDAGSIIKSIQEEL